MSVMSLSRPHTQQSHLNLPQIQHPSARLDPEAGRIVLQGNSRQGFITTQADIHKRPFTAERTYTSRLRLDSAPDARNTSQSLTSDRLNTEKSRHNAFCIHESDNKTSFQFDSIPENCEVALNTDSNKPALPIFGRKSVDRENLQSRSGVCSRAESRVSTASLHKFVDAEEIESKLKEKVLNNYSEVKKKFYDNDIEGKGNVSKEALFRIFVTLLNRPMITSVFNTLWEKFGFKDRKVVNFNDFYSFFRPIQSGDYPRWMDPIQRKSREKSMMSASQVHVILKEKAKQRVTDLVSLIPQTNPGGTSYIIKPEMRNALQKMGYFMEDREFEKLWDKYDTEGIGTVNGEILMSKWGITVEPLKNLSQEGHQSAKKADVLIVEKQTNSCPGNVELKMKETFFDGFALLKKSFESNDPHLSGLISYDEFIDVLANAGIEMNKENLKEFLNHCDIKCVSKCIPYRDLLVNFQKRNDVGMVNKILTDPNHSYNNENTKKEKSITQNAEAKLMKIFQEDFLALLSSFQQYDVLGLNLISQENFRVVIEEKFGALSDDQFCSLIDRVPLNEDGMVKYVKFMSQFDVNNKYEELFENKLKKPKRKLLAILPEEPNREKVAQSSDSDSDNESLLVLDRENIPVINRSDSDIFLNPKRQEVISKLMKVILRKKYGEVVAVFEELDEQNTKRITKDLMFELLKRFNFDPEVTQGEIRALWNTFILNTDGTLYFDQFVRHFGYSLKSAAYPNSKVCPPKRGDHDCRIRTKKLNCAVDILQDGFKRKIKNKWADIYQAFKALDEENSGYVDRIIFFKIMFQFGVNFNGSEEDEIPDFFLDGKQRVSYEKFLAFFEPSKRIWREGNDMSKILHHLDTEMPINDIVEPPTQGLPSISTTSRQKICSHWKYLRREFRKCDHSNSGNLTREEFKNALKKIDMILTDEEVYKIMTKFDKQLTGKIPWKHFLEDLKSQRL